jgi:hypothetical protein
MTPTWVKSLAAVGVVAALLFLTLLALGTLKLRRIDAAVGARVMAHRWPCLRNTPVALTDTSASPARGGQIAFAGVTFSVPWNDLASEHDRKEFGMLVLKFDSGETINVVVTGPAPKLLDLTQGSVEPGNDPEMKAFELERAIANTTLDDIRIWRQSDRAATLFNVKAIRVDSCKQAEIFSISTPQFRGFQYGTPRPGVWDSKLELRLFSSSHIVVFDFPGAYPHAPLATQADINLIAQSLREMD